MSAFAAPIEVVQAALHRVGEESISSMDEGSAAALVAASNYEGIVRAQLKRHAWTFATDTVNLTHQAEVELGLWTHAYVYPASVINIRWVMLGGVKQRSGDWTLQKRRVLTRLDDAGYQAVVTTRATESEWSDDFAEAMVVRLQGLFLESLCDKPQDGRPKIKDAEALFRIAIVVDKRQTPGEATIEGDLQLAWRGGRRRWA
jgi:hypothetical protein